MTSPSFLTIDTMRAADNVRYGKLAALLSPATVPGLSGVWASRFGDLNRIFILQTGSDASPPFPSDIQLDDRERMTLTTLRPFSSPAGNDVQELRAYDVAPGLGDRFCELMMDSIGTRTGYSPNFGVWRTTGGRVDRVYHMWAYANLAERDAVRSRLSGDPVWQTYTATILPMLGTMRSTLLTPLALYT